MNLTFRLAVGPKISEAAYLKQIFDSVGVTQETQEKVVRYAVSRYAIMMAENDIKPSLEGFVERNPEWQRPDMYDAIEEEIGKVMGL